MRFSSPLTKIIFIFILAAVAGIISLPKNLSVFGRNFVRPDLNLQIGNLSLARNFDLILGLDLAGGSHLVFEADVSNVPEERRANAVSGVRDVIERRVNLFGIGEPNVQTATFEGKQRIIVELPGVKEPKEAIKLIGKTAQLGFAEVSGEGEEQA